MNKTNQHSARIEIYGPGIDLEIFEISKEDCQLLKGTDVDYSEVEEVMERSQDLSHVLGLTEPLASELILKYQKSEEDKPIEIQVPSKHYLKKREEVITKLGVCYLAQVIEIRRNHWGTIHLDSELDTSLLSVIESNPTLGLSGNLPYLQWASLGYGECEVELERSFDGSSELYLIDASGDCQEIEI